MTFRCGTILQLQSCASHCSKASKKTSIGWKWMNLPQKWNSPCTIRSTNCKSTAKVNTFPSTNERALLSFFNQKFEVKQIIGIKYHVYVCYSLFCPFFLIASNLNMPWKSLNYFLCSCINRDSVCRHWCEKNVSKNTNENSSRVKHNEKSWKLKIGNSILIWA